MTPDQASYKSAYDNLKPADRKSLQARIEKGGVSSEKWFELRKLFLELTERKQA
jgi:hypothetical protein